MVFQLIALFVIGLAMSFAGKSDALLRPVETVLAFLILNFYFAFFEIRWQGQTPGKRRVGIRVIDARGGQLETSAVLARNLVRELEVWTPLRFLLLNRTLWPDAPGWALILAMGWTMVFLFMPLFNKDKLRVGDLVAGTRVVMQPKPVLVPDLVSQAANSMQMRAQAAPTYTFTEAQLGIYGIYELQVLEGVLRQDPASIGLLRGDLDGHRQDPRQDQLQWPDRGQPSLPQRLLRRPPRAPRAAHAVRPAQSRQVLPQIGDGVKVVKASVEPICAKFVRFLGFLGDGVKVVKLGPRRE